MSQKPVLHNYFRSSTSVRVRIALAIKGVEYDYVPIHLRKGEQKGEAFIALNPQGLVPALVWRDGSVITQSLAILEFLEEELPDPPLLPKNPLARARVRSLAQMVALDIHPINNLRVLQYLRDHYGQDDEGVAVWFRHWAGETFSALERRLASEADTGSFCQGETATIADLCLVSQVLNGARFKVDMTPYPTVQRIHEHCMTLPAFIAGAPMSQPDAE